MNKWLEDNKVADEVIIQRGGYGRHSSIECVERLTKTQIIITGVSTRYMRSDGNQIGGSSFHGAWLKEGKPELIAKVKEVNRRITLLHRIGSAKLSDFTTPHLEMIAQSIKETG